MNDIEGLINHIYSCEMCSNDIHLSTYVMCYDATVNKEPSLENLYVAGNYTNSIINRVRFIHF